MQKDGKAAVRDLVAWSNWGEEEHCEASLIFIAFVRKMDRRLHPIAHGYYVRMPSSDRKKTMSTMCGIYIRTSHRLSRGKSDPGR